MKEYIERETFIKAKRRQYCGDCERRKGIKNGKMKFCYKIGEAPCRACSIDDMLNDVEDFPAADVVEVDSVIPFVRVCDRKEYIKNSEKLINEYLAELLERFGVRCLAQSDNINGTVKFWAEKMDGGADDE